MKKTLDEYILDVMITETTRLGLGGPHVVGKYAINPSDKNKNKYYPQDENKWVFDGEFKEGDFVKVKRKPIYGLIVAKHHVYKTLYDIGDRYEKSFLIKISGYKGDLLEVGAKSLILASKSKTKQLQ